MQLTENGSRTHRAARPEGPGRAGGFWSEGWDAALRWTRPWTPRVRRQVLAAGNAGLLVVSEGVGAGAEHLHLGRDCLSCVHPLGQAEGPSQHNFFKLSSDNRATSSHEGAAQGGAV